jgi:hypothetical protein
MANVIFADCTWANPSIKVLQAVMSSSAPCVLLTALVVEVGTLIIASASASKAPRRQAESCVATLSTRVWDSFMADAKTTALSTRS